jgi:hypothetical protein
VEKLQPRPFGFDLRLVSLAESLVPAGQKSDQAAATEVIYDDERGVGKCSVTDVLMGDGPRRQEANYHHPDDHPSGDAQYGTPIESTAP